jgi:hypothetical protein
MAPDKSTLLFTTQRSDEKTPKKPDQLDRAKNDPAVMSFICKTECALK